MQLVLRIPSLAAMLAAADSCFSWRRASSAGRPQSTPPLPLSAPAGGFAAADARPYALGLCFLTGAGLMLVRWLDSGRRRDLAGYSLLSALAIYTHYLLVSALLVFAAYALYRLAGQARTRLLPLLAAWIFSGALVLPLAAQFLQFYSSRASPLFRGHTRIRRPGHRNLAPGSCGAGRFGRVGRMAAFSRKKARERL